MHQKVQHKYSPEDTTVFEYIHVEIGKLVLFGQVAGDSVEAVDNLQERRLWIPDSYIWVRVSNQAANRISNWFYFSTPCGMALTA